MINSFTRKDFTTQKMNKKFYNMIKNSILLILVILLSISPFITAHAAESDVNTSTDNPDNTQLKKVRVGYLTYHGYQEGEGDEPKSGYGYEYLQQIAYYAGWEYEYVNGSFNELLDMLKKGEIDIMGNISYTEERAQDISYATEEQGREYYYLFVREDRTDISATEPSTLQGAKVGINKGSIQVGLFQDWCEKNHVTCQIELYDNSEERYADMNSGKLDAIVSTTVSEQEISKYRWNSILKIGYSPYYFAVSKKDPELYDELNNAITKVLQSDWYYNEKVYLKYNENTSASSAGLDTTDKEWLENKGTIKIGYTDNLLPYSDWKDNKIIGLLSTYIDHMKDRYNADFEPVKFDNFDDMIQALQEGSIDTAFPVYGSYWTAEENNLMITDALTTGYMLMIYKDTYNEDTSSVIATIKGNPFQQFCIKEHFPDSEIKFYKNIQECLDAVNSGKATCTLMCSDVYYAYRNDMEDMSHLNLSNTGYDVPVSFAVRRNDIEMYIFLKKGLASMEATEIREALITEDYANPEMNVRQFLQKHVVLVIIVFSVVLALILTLFIYYLISRRKARSLSQRNSALSEKAYIDLATGLPNKNKCEEILSSKLAISKPTACFMLDLNDLKKVNDTLGHEMGDIMILNFAKLLRKVVPLPYFVGRFGGDEFIVIAEDISGKEEAEELVQKIKEMILKFNGLRGEFQINYACGFAFSADYPGANISDLLNEADIKMYEDKVRTKAERKRTVSKLNSSDASISDEKNKI